MGKAPVKILVVDDDKDVLTAARVTLRQEFPVVDLESNASRVLKLMREKAYDVVLLDMNFAAGRTSGNEGLYLLQQILAHSPHQKVILLTAYSSVAVAVEAMKMGAADFIVKPWSNERLLEVVRAASRGRDKDKDRSRSREADLPPVQIIGESPSVRRVLDEARKVAGSDANVLLLGENGTGKDLFAHYIHHHSRRNQKPFVKVDVGSLSLGIFESEMFGHKKGAFTDAHADRKGRFELAQGGTLFLDEIGNLTLPFQAKLLSILQDRKVTPLGSAEPVPVDVRLITASNANLEKCVRENAFREDLLYRINTIAITIPPLRERKEDIPLLIQYFVGMYCEKYGYGSKEIGDDVLPLLADYSWPGNVRELQHAVERAVVMSDEDVLTRGSFRLSRASVSHVSGMNLEEMERTAIINAIEKYDANLTQVAKALGLGRTTLYRKMVKYGIHK